MKKLFPSFLLAIIAALCLSLGFYWEYGVLGVFVGFSLIWKAEDLIRQNFRKPGWAIYSALFLFLLSWNVLATWWVHLTGALWVIAVANSLVMFVPFRLWFWLKKTLDPRWSLFIFVVIWLGFEFFHHNWQLTWIWLTLGNAFLYKNTWVQWYEFTGVLGGSLWILGANVLLYHFYHSQGKFRLKYAAIFIGYFAVPWGVSQFLYHKSLPKPIQELNVLIVQPNINPFTEKFPNTAQYIPIEKQTDILLRLSKEYLQKNTDLVVFPETAIDENFTESLIAKYPNFQRVDSFVKNHHTEVLMGISTRAFFKTKQSPTSTYAKSVNAFYEDFNAAVYLKADTFSLYKKMILVPGVETIPFPEYTIFLKDFISNIGAQFFLLGTGKQQEVFNTPKAKVAPIICYESMYGEFTAGFVKKGANVLCTITNDGWLGDTPWQKHHLYLGALRSIETRKSMIHCSNMGVSGFIDPKGDIGKTIPYNQRTALLGNIYVYEGSTFYVLYGDYLGKIACLLLFGLIAFVLVKKTLPNFK